MNDETKAFVEACEQRASMATSGPIDIHRYDNDGGDIRYQLQQSPSAPVKDADGCCQVITDFSDLDNPKARNDAEFYAHARTDLPQALRIIREQDAENSALTNEWLGDMSAIAKELAAFGFVDESGGDGIVLAVRNALTKQRDELENHKTVMRTFGLLPAVET